MDESGARTLLERLTADEPPSRVDVAAARLKGRRWRRRRWITLTTTPLAAVSAAAALALTGVIPLGTAARAPGLSAAAQSAAAVTPQSQFDLLVPYASFGQLSGGFSVADGVAMGGDAYSTPQMLVLEAGSPSTDHLLTVEVYPAGACSYRSDMSASQVPPGQAAEYYEKQYHQRLAGACDGLPLAAAAPAVGGDRAFWTPRGGLAWEYAPGSWAHMQPEEATTGPVRLPRNSGFGRWLYRHAIGWRNGFTLAGHPTTTQSAATQALMLQAADGMRYNAATPLLFGFHLTGLPGVWQSQSAQYAASGSLLLGRQLQVGAAGSPYSFGIRVSPANSGTQSCQYVPGLPSNRESILTIGGARWLMRATPNAIIQSLCAADYQGVSVSVAAWGGRHSTPPLSLLVSVVRHLKLLGPNPANWTSTPLG